MRTVSSMADAIPGIPCRVFSPFPAQTGGTAVGGPIARHVGRNVVEVAPWIVAAPMPMIGSRFASRLCFMVSSFVVCDSGGLRMGFSAGGPA